MAKELLWKKPLEDSETFILTLFLLCENGCPPEVILKWTENTLKKRHSSKVDILSNIYV